jgi:hypothetical protein
VHFESFAITNHIHRYLEFSISKYQPISGRDPNIQHPTSNNQARNAGQSRQGVKAESRNGREIG